MSIQQKYQQLLLTIKQYPLEMGMAALFAIGSIFILFPLPSQSPFVYWLFAPLYFVAIYLCRPYPRLYRLAWLIPIGGSLLVYWAGHNLDFYMDDSRFWVSYAIGLISLCSMPLMNNNRTFMVQFHQRLFSVMLSAIIALVIASLLVLLNEVVDVLFNLSSPYDLSHHFYVFCMCFFMPLFFLHFAKTTLESQRFNGFFSTLALVLTPILMIYTLIVYFYVVKIILIGELPTGVGVSTMLPYAILGLVTYLFQDIGEKQKNSWFFRAFPFIALVPFALLWLGIYQRVVGYALTEKRIYLLMFCTLLSLIQLTLFVKKWRQYRYWSLIAMGLMFACVLLNPEKIGLQNQLKRLDTLLLKQQLLDEQHKIRQDVDFEQILTHLTQPQINDYREITELHTYLRFRELKGGFSLETIYGKKINELRNFYIYKNGEVLKDSEFITTKQKIVFQRDAQWIEDIRGYKRMITWKIGNFNRPNGNEKEKVVYCLEYNEEKFGCLDLNEVIHNIFKNNQLDIKKKYDEATLLPLSEQFLTITSPKGDKKVLFSRFTIEYKEGEGYIFNSAEETTLLVK